MFDLIPASVYVPIYYHFVLAVMLILSGILISSPSLQDPNVKAVSQTFGFAVVVLVIWYMGTRPVNFRFGDMVIYNRVYQDLQSGGQIIVTKDYLFNYLMILCSKIMPANTKW